MRFGSSGIRAQYGPALIRTALSVGTVLGAPGRELIVGMDTRTTSPVLAGAFSAGALSAGALVRTAGLAPTPAVALATPSGGYGCMITASHNPEEYNGLKIFNPGGSSLLRSQQVEVEESLQEGETGILQSEWDEFGRTVPAAILESYRERILHRIPEISGISMVLDCGNGAGSVASPEILAGLGIRVHALNCNPSGKFSRPSEPLRENLPYIPSLIRKLGAAGAVVHDGDADRMVAFDAEGTMIPGDAMLILFARYLGAKRVVTTSDASMAVEEWAEVRRTPVGDAFVSEELTRWGDFGGEPSGAWIFPGHSLCPDGPYAAALFSRIVSDWDVREELAEIPAYPMVRISIPCPDPSSVMKSLGADSPTDGIRLADEDGWCLIRASGTEPKIRITAEGRTRRKADQMQEKGLAAVKAGKKT